MTVVRCFAPYLTWTSSSSRELARSPPSNGDRKRWNWHILTNCRSDIVLRFSLETLITPQAIFMNIHQIGMDIPVKYDHASKGLSQTAAIRSAFDDPSGHMSSAIFVCFMKL